MNVALLEGYTANYKIHRELCDQSLIYVRTIVVVFEGGIRWTIFTKVQDLPLVRKSCGLVWSALFLLWSFSALQNLLREFSRIFHCNPPLGPDLRMSYQNMTKSYRSIFEYLPIIFIYKCIENISRFPILRHIIAGLVFISGCLGSFTEVSPIWTNFVSSCNKRRITS